MFPMQMHAEWGIVRDSKATTLMRRTNPTGQSTDQVITVQMKAITGQRYLEQIKYKKV